MSEYRGLSSYRRSLSATVHLSALSYQAGGVQPKAQSELQHQRQPMMLAAVAPPRECRVEWSMACDLKVKYEQIDDLDELNRLLRENTDFDERRALRAVIRTVKERQTASGAGGSSSNGGGSGGYVKDGYDGSVGTVSKREDVGAQTVATPTYRRPAEVLPLAAEVGSWYLGGTAAAAAAAAADDDDEEERLRRRLHQTLDYDEKKRIRAAIRDIRKRKGASLDQQQPLLPPESPSEPIVTGFSSSGASCSSGCSSAPVATTTGISSSRGSMQLSPRRHVRPVSWAAPLPAFVSSGTVLAGSASADRAAVVTQDASHDKTVGSPAMGNAACTPSSAAVSHCDHPMQQSMQWQQELRKSTSEQTCGTGLSKSEVVTESASSNAERSSPERTNHNQSQQPSVVAECSTACEVAVTAASPAANRPVSSTLKAMSDQAEVEIPVPHAPAGPVPHALAGPLPAKTVASAADASPNGCAAEQKPAGGLESHAAEPATADSTATPGKVKSSLIRLQSDKTNATGKLQAGALANFNRLNNGPGIGRVSSLRIVSTRKPPRIVLPLSDTKAIDGSSQLSLTVGLCDAGSSPTALWYKNGRLLRPCKEMQQQCDQQAARLVLEEVFPDDAGVYRCVVQNEFGQAETSARLTVESNPLWKTPEFVLGLEDKTVKSGTTLVLRVQVLAVPNPVLLWYRDDELLDDSQHVQQSFDGTTGTLTVSSIGAGGAGVYRCLARNSVGEQQTACHLTIAGSDDSSELVQGLCISQGLESIEPHDGDVGVSLSCSLSTAVVAAHVIWSKNGKVLISNDDMKQSFDGVKATLMFNEIFPDDAGMYTCEIKLGELVLVTTSLLKVVGQKVEAPAAASGVAVNSAVSDVPTTRSSVHADESIVQPHAETLSAGSSLVGIVNASHDGLPDPINTQSSPNSLSLPIKADTNNNNEFSSIMDEAELQKVLDSAQDYETRKKIRARLRELREAKRAERDSDRRRLDDEKAAEAKRKFAEAEQDKKKILDKFAELARTSSIGAKPSASDELARRNVTLADDDKRQALQEFQERAKDSIGARTSLQQEVLKFKVESADQAKEANLRAYQNVARSEADQRKGSSSSSGGRDQQPVTAASGPPTREPARPAAAATEVAAHAAKPSGGTKVQTSEPAAAVQPVPQQQHQSVLTRAPAAAGATQQPRPVSMSLKLELQPSRALAGAAAAISAPLSAPITSPSPAARWSPAAAAAVGPTQATVQAPMAEMAPVATTVPQTPTRAVIGTTASLRLELQQPQSLAAAAPLTPARTGGVVTPLQAPTPQQQSRPLSVLSPNEETSQAQNPKKEVADSRSPDHHDGASKTPLRVAFSTPSPVMPPGSAKTPPAGAKGAMAAFKQLDKTNNPSVQQARPNYMSSPSTPSATSATSRSGGALQRSVSDIKEMLLNWCRHATKDYKISIDNYSTSWNNGMAFCALIHHFYPEAFDYNSLDPKNRRYNFTLAFDTAEKYADISPLLDVEDMVRMEKPDWKCVFTYVQSFYRKLRNSEVNKHQYAEN